MERILKRNLERNIVRDVLLEEEGTPQQQVAATALQLAGISMDFARVERTPRYADSRRESDVEHSFMLAMVASELAVQLYPDQLDVGLINQYATVHDLIELRTEDVATFSISDEALADKEAAEQAALAQLLSELPPYTAQLLAQYESQVSREARFVRAVDKILPVMVDILGDGMRIMVEDYDTHNDEELLKAHVKLMSRMKQRFNEFPDIIAAYGLLCELFEEEASTQWPAQNVKEDA